MKRNLLSSLRNPSSKLKKSDQILSHWFDGGRYLKAIDHVGEFDQYAHHIMTYLGSKVPFSSRSFIDEPIWPSLDTICSATRMKKSTARNKLKWLVENHYLTCKETYVKSHNDRLMQSSNRYSFTEKLFLQYEIYLTEKAIECEKLETKAIERLKAKIASFEKKIDELDCEKITPLKSSMRAKKAHSRKVRAESKLKRELKKCLKRNIEKEISFDDEGIPSENEAVVVPINSKRRAPRRTIIRHNPKASDGGPHQPPSLPPGVRLDTPYYTSKTPYEPPAFFSHYSPSEGTPFTRERPPHHPLVTNYPSINTPNKYNSSSYVTSVMYQTCMEKRKEEEEFESEDFSFLDEIRRRYIKLFGDLPSQREIESFKDEFNAHLGSDPKERDKLTQTVLEALSWVHDRPHLHKYVKSLNFVWHMKRFRERENTAVSGARNFLRGLVQSGRSINDAIREISRGWQCDEKATALWVQKHVTPTLV